MFEAHDLERQASVALKLMRRRDPQALLFFKQEFRTLAGMAHPNLVQFYELHSDGEQWFFTLELIRGTSFLEEVRAFGQEGPPFHAAPRALKASWLRGHQTPSRLSVPAWEGGCIVVPGGRGRRRRKVEPTPGVLSTSMLPP